MASQPPPDPNRSIDLKAAAAAASSASSTQDGDTSDIQTDGILMTKGMRLATAPGVCLPPNIQRGIPPINPAQFNQYAYAPQFNQAHTNMTGANIINITNSHNVQIGRTNIMNLNIARHGPAPYFRDTDSDSDSEDDTLAIEESRLQELRRCEREVSNIELQDIAQHVGLGWRRLVRFLGLQDYDVDEVYEEYGNNGLEEVVYQLMKRWKCEVANPTVSEMLYQIQRCDMGHLAKHLRNDDFQYTD